MARRRPHHGSARRGRTAGPRKKSHELQGVVRIQRPGMGSVEAADGVFALARGGQREAMNGDKVWFVLAGEKGREPRAVVRSVIERAQHTFLGIYTDAGVLGAVRPLDARLGRDFFVVPEDPSPERLGVAHGDVVVARIEEYPTRYSAPVVTLERRVGSADELDLNIESVVASFGLPSEFDARVLAEAEVLAPHVDEALAQDPARRDLRGMLCVTVDPVDARDFDDAVSVRELEDGGFELGVHIADVSHYVTPGSSLDAEAAQRTCSAYLADRVVPMLPERLCNDVCSLRPNEDRLAMSVLVRLDACGRVTAAEACASAICSAARLTYDQADALLEGRLGPSELPVADGRGAEVAELVRAADRLRALREQVRHARGALDFSTVESRVVLDGAGKPTGVSVRRRTRATGLIEEAMLVANECVARMLADVEAPAAFRVHEPPQPDGLKRCVVPLSELGLIDNEQTAAVLAAEPAALQGVLARAAATPGAYLASALLLRAQSRAVYLPHNQGHYALGAAAYCHFTSPIRRYPDVLVHRALKALLAGTLDGREMRAQKTALPQLCATCSERERAAEGAARASQKIKMAELFAERIGQRFEGVVSGCERFGVFVTLDETQADGLIGVRALGHDWFVYDEARMTLTGESTGEVWGLGRRVTVQVADVNVARGQIDFVPVADRDASGEKPVRPAGAPRPGRGAKGARVVRASRPRRRD